MLEDWINFKFSSEEFQNYFNKWYKNEWPISFLIRDHYSSKIFEDNKLFELIKFYKHNWKWNEEEGLIILFKKKKENESEWIFWNNILPSINIIKTKENKFLIKNLIYGQDGFEFINNNNEEKKNFIFNSNEFKEMLTKFIKEEWPVSFLLRDHYGAKVLYDNQVFQLIKFYGHKWIWDDKNGLSILFKKSPTSKIEFTNWNEISNIISIQKTPQGWLLFDGWNYTQNGLIGIHLWQWKKLPVSYIFPIENRPNYCYVDIIAFCWEHSGMQGFGFGGNPHGHVAIEFGDDLGNFYSVGQYMDPRSKINTKIQPAATVKACLMSPDPYMPSKGEKTLHRYFIGKGIEGRKNIKKLKKYIENIQGWKKDLETGIITTCPNRKYHTFSNNCGNFVKEIENFTKYELNGKLIKFNNLNNNNNNLNNNNNNQNNNNNNNLNNNNNNQNNNNNNNNQNNNNLIFNEIFPPLRKKILKKNSNYFLNIFIKIYNYFLLFFLYLLIFIIILIPGLSNKLGVGIEDENIKKEIQLLKKQKNIQQQQQQINFKLNNNNNNQNNNNLKFLNFIIKIYSILKSLKPNSINFPRRIRLQQLYGNELKDYSITLYT